MVATHQAVSDTDQSTSTPEYWKDYAGSVRVNNVPLVPLDQLANGHIYTSAVMVRRRGGEMVQTGGNEIVIDTDFAYYQVGKVLDQLGFKVKDIGSKKLNDFISETLKYYPEQYDKERKEKDADKIKIHKERAYSSAVKSMQKVYALSGKTDRDNWTQSEWIEWMSQSGLLPVE